MRYAHGIVSEYLTEELAKKLLHYLNLPDEVENKMKRKLLNPKEGPEEKRPKKEPLEIDNSSRTRALDLTKPEKVRIYSLIKYEFLYY